MARPPRRKRAEDRSAASEGTKGDDRPARRRAKGGAKPAEVETKARANAKANTKVKAKVKVKDAGSDTSSGRRSWRRDLPPDAAERERRNVLARIHQGRPRLIRRLLDLLGPSADGARQSMVALVLNSATSLAAGAVLGSITGTFERLPGLLVLVPAAIGLRGNVFSSLGNRLSTSIHVGTFRLSLRPQTVMGQNMAASLVLTLSLSLALAVVAKVVAVALGVIEHHLGVRPRPDLGPRRAPGIGRRARGHRRPGRRLGALRLGPRQRDRPAGLDPR